MGKSCANTIKRNQQNVAIATQVLNPSAIGGSLRGQRALKHFGPPDDDEEEFFMYQRRAAWKKIGTYGLAIIVTILILMGIILCIGYIQTKQNDNIISSRSVQLIQERKPFSYIYTSKTTPDPPSLEPTDSLEFTPTSHSSFLHANGKQDVVEESDTGNSQNEEFYYPSLHSGESSNHEGDEDYTHSYNSNDNNHHHNSASDTKEQQNQQHIHGPDKHNTQFYQDHEDDTRDGARVNSEDIHESLNTSSLEKHDNESDEQLDDKESVHDDVSENNGDEKFSGIVEMTETIEESLKGNKEYEELPKQGKVLPPSGSVFSVEIPIYDPNKTTSRYEDEDGENVNAEKKELDPIDDNDDQVNEKSKDNTTTKTDTVTESLTINVTPEIIDKSNGSASVDYPKNNRRNFVDNEPFHQAVLHTALFHFDEDKLNVKPKPVATTIIIEDQDFEGFDDQDYLDRGSPYESIGRNEKKMKILKNDRVMNMKATFTPPEKASKSAESISNKSQYGLDDSTEINIYNSKNGRKPAAPKHRAKNGIQHDGENKTIGNEWKLRLRKNKDENATKDFSAMEDDLSDQKYPGQASSNKNVNLSVPNHYEDYPPALDKFEDKPRLLSSSSFLPNFEDFLKTILTNVQLLNTKKISSPRSKEVSPGRMASEINYANSINQLIPPPSTLPTLPLEQDSSQFRKRTFNTEHDFLAFPSSNQDFTAHQTQNYFDHLLGQYPTVGAIGNPSAMGASLSNFYSPIYPTASPTSTIPQYDINPSSTTGISQYAPGIVPLDLASSFIQAGIPKTQQPGSGYGRQQQPGQTQPYEFNNLYGNFPQFPLPNVPKAEGIGTVTTYNGQPPTYNSISQGMQLFNLISGTVPNSYYHDQVYNPTPSTPSSFQTDPFTISPQFNFGSGSTTSSFGLPNIGVPPSNSQSHEYGNIVDINTPQSSPQPFLELHPFDYHHPHPQEHTSSTDRPVQGRQPTYQSPLVARAYALKSDRDKVEKFLEEDDHDQQPAASRSILTTIKRPKISGLPVGPQHTTTAGSIITLFSKPKTKTASIFRTPSNQLSNPNSFSFEILPHKNRKSEVHPSANSVFNDDDPMDLARERRIPTFDVSGSASKKKSGANPEKSWNIFSSHPNTVNGQNENIAAEKYMPSRRKSIRRIKTNRPNVGLKSGFYTR